MINTNEYSASIHRLPEEKLREYIQKPEEFHDEAVLAAIWELAKRRPLRKDERNLETELTERVKVPEIQLKGTYNDESIKIGATLPSLYSTLSIQLFSTIFSPFVGGILMAINFNRTAQKAEIIKVLGFSLLYTLTVSLIYTLTATQLLAYMGSMAPFIVIFLNFLGGILIIELFWKRVFGNEYKYTKQQAWTTLSIIILIEFLIMMLYLLTTGNLPTF